MNKRSNKNQAATERGINTRFHFKQTQKSQERSPLFHQTNYEDRSSKKYSVADILQSKSTTKEEDQLLLDSSNETASFGGRNKRQQHQEELCSSGFKFNHSPPSSSSQSFSQPSLNNHSTQRDKFDIKLADLLKSTKTTTNQEDYVKMCTDLLSQSLGYDSANHSQHLQQQHFSQQQLLSNSQIMSQHPLHFQQTNKQQQQFSQSSFGGRGPANGNEKEQPKEPGVLIYKQNQQKQNNPETITSNVMSKQQKQQPQKTSGKPQEQTKPAIDVDVIFSGLQEKIDYFPPQAPKVQSLPKCPVTRSQTLIKYVLECHEWRHELLVRKKESLLEQQKLMREFVHEMRLLKKLLDYYGEEQLRLATEKMNIVTNLTQTMKVMCQDGVDGDGEEDGKSEQEDQESMNYDDQEDQDDY